MEMLNFAQTIMWTIAHLIAINVSLMALINALSAQVVLLEQA